MKLRACAGARAEHDDRGNRVSAEAVLAEARAAGALSERRGPTAPLDRLARLEAAERSLAAYPAAEGARMAGDVVEGLAAPCGRPSRPIADGAGAFVEIFAPGAFARSILAARGGAGEILATWGHREIILGSTAWGDLNLWETEEGLRFRLAAGRIEAVRREAVGLGNIKVSVQFKAVRQEWGGAGKERRRLILEAQLAHVSLLSGNPVYAETWTRMRPGPAPGRN